MNVIPGPEQCSLAWVFNEKICVVSLGNNSVNCRRQEPRYFVFLINCGIRNWWASRARDFNLHEYKWEARSSNLGTWEPENSNNVPAANLVKNTREKYALANVYGSHGS
jgi:hypothetical protein